jgi:hypothetical protein
MMLNAEQEQRELYAIWHGCFWYLLYCWIQLCAGVSYRIGAVIFLWSFIGRKWLDDVVVASGVNPVLDIGRLGHCRGREDRDVLSLRILRATLGWLASNPSLAS